MDLCKATEIAQKIANLVSISSFRTEIAGSIRRQKQSVKDIEIVSIISNYDDLYQDLSKVGRFIKPSVPQVIDWEPKVGAKYVRMLLHDEIKLDLFIATPENWGGILMLRTGSGVDESGSSFNGFSAGILQRWKKISNGGKMSGGKLFTPEGYAPLQSEEKHVFDLVGLEWIPPQERISKKIMKKYIKQL